MGRAGKGAGAVGGGDVSCRGRAMEPQRPPISHASVAGWVARSGWVWLGHPTFLLTGLSSWISSRSLQCGGTPSHFVGQNKPGGQPQPEGGGQWGGPAASLQRCAPVGSVHGHVWQSAP